MDRAAGGGRGVSGGADVPDHAALPVLVRAWLRAVDGGVAGRLVGFCPRRLDNRGDANERGAGGRTRCPCRDDAVLADPAAAQDRRCHAGLLAHQHGQPAGGRAAVAGDPAGSGAGVRATSRTAVGNPADLRFRGRRDQRHGVQDRAVSGLVPFAGATVPAGESAQHEAVIAGSAHPAAAVGLFGGVVAVAGRRRLSHRLYLSGRRSRSAVGRRRRR